MKSKIKIAIMVLFVGCCAAFAAKIATDQNSVSMGEKECSYSCPSQKSCGEKACCGKECSAKPCGEAKQCDKESAEVACKCSKPKDGKPGYEKPAVILENSEQTIACACPARKGNGEKPKSEKV